MIFKAEAEESGSDELQVVSALSEQIAEEPKELLKPAEEAKAPPEEPKEELKSQAAEIRKAPPAPVEVKVEKVDAAKPAVKSEEVKVQVQQESIEKASEGVREAATVKAPQESSRQEVREVATVKAPQESSHPTDLVQNGEVHKTQTAVLTGIRQVENFHVGVEVNVDVDDMSRRYSGLSSSKGE